MSSNGSQPEHDCLAEPENLEELEDDRPGVMIRVCSVCGRRHFEVVAEPFQIGVEVPE